MKRAQELRVDKFSVQNLRQSHGTIQRLTSQMQELQEQINYLNASGEFQEVESNYSGKFSHVPSQPARISSPRSMLSCDKRLQPETWNLSGPQENVFVNPRSRFESSQTPCRGILHSTTPSAAGEAPALISTGRFVAREEERIGSTIVGQQRQEISELQFDKFRTPQSFLCWKKRFRNQVTTCSDFTLEAMLWIKEVEMVDSMEDLSSSRSVAGKNFPNFEMLDARIASALNMIIQNSHFKKRVNLEEQKAQKEDRFLGGRQIAVMICDYSRATGVHDTVLDYADLFSVTLRNCSVQEFDTRWTKFYYLCQRFHPFRKVCTN